MADPTRSAEGYSKEVFWTQSQHVTVDETTTDTTIPDVVSLLQENNLLLRDIRDHFVLLVNALK